MPILNANAKNYQSDSVLQQRMHSEKAKEQRVAAAIDASGEDACLDNPLPEEASPEADTPVANMRSRSGSSPRLVTQEVLMTMLNVSSIDAKLMSQITASRKFPPQLFFKYAKAVLYARLPALDQAPQA